MIVYAVQNIVNLYQGLFPQAGFREMVTLTHSRYSVWGFRLFYKQLWDQEIECIRTSWVDAHLCRQPERQGQS